MSQKEGAGKSYVARTADAEQERMPIGKTPIAFAPPMTRHQQVLAKWNSLDAAQQDAIIESGNWNPDEEADLKKRKKRA